MLIKVDSLIRRISRIFLGPPKGNLQEYIFLHGAKRVSWEGIQTKTNFYFRERTFTFRGRREEGQDV